MTMQRTLNGHLEVLSGYPEAQSSPSEAPYGHPEVDCGYPEAPRAHLEALSGHTEILWGLHCHLGPHDGH